MQQRQLHLMQQLQQRRQQGVYQPKLIHCTCSNSKGSAAAVAVTITTSTAACTTCRLRQMALLQGSPSGGSRSKGRPGWQPSRQPWWRLQQQLCGGVMRGRRLQPVKGPVGLIGWLPAQPCSCSWSNRSAGGSARWCTLVLLLWARMLFASRAAAAVLVGNLLQQEIITRMR